jgi:hypothetical protein
LFSSICKENKMSHLDIMLDQDLKRHFGTFRYRPVVKELLEEGLIYHPVK